MHLPHLPRWFHRAAPVLFAVAVGLVGAWAGMQLWGHTTTSVGPFRVELTSSFGPGETDISLPPFGSLSADTHAAPLRLRATLKDVEVQRLSEALSSSGSDGLVSTVSDDAIARMRPFAIRVLLASAAGALLLALLAFRRDARRVAIAVATALLTVGGSQIWVLATFRSEAFLHPTYTGTLALAPQVIGPVEQAAAKIDAFRTQLGRVVDGAVRAYTSLQASPLGAGNEIRVLHISDIHLSPVGFDFARQIAAGFDVDFVLDTGDITSFGTPAESLILASIPAFHKPYVFVRGSHDSLELQREVARIPNATVLDGDTTTVDGITLYGLGDPVFVDNRSDPLDSAEFARIARSVCPRILADVQALPAPPDILAVHDEKMAECVAGSVPFVASGHLHVNESRTQNGTLFLKVGTTGGAGPTLFTDQGAQDLSAEVLYFKPGTPPQLVAYDVIVQDPQTGNLTVTRHLVTAQQLVPPTPPPGSGPTPTPSPSGASPSSG
jgi:predicted phosphodiesterase